MCEEPFSRVLIDCVGPLPKTKKGHEYLFPIMDVTTRFPVDVSMEPSNVFPLQKEDVKVEPIGIRLGNSAYLQDLYMYLNICLPSSRQRWRT